MINPSSLRREFCFAAALVLSAASASAHIEARPVLAAPAVPAPAAAAFAPIAPLAVLTAVGSAAPPPAAVQAVGPTSDMSAALADFGRVDLRSASAVEASAAGETLMTRVLGGGGEGPPAVFAEPPDAPALSLERATRTSRPAGRSTYLLATPLHETVELGFVARFLHYALETGVQAGKALVAWKATGSWQAAAAVLAFELVKMPPMITAQSLADLGLRYWRRKLSVLREIARAPGVEKIRVLTAGDVSFSGPLAWRAENTGIIFVESSAGLPGSIGRFGAPIPLGDLAERRVRLTMTQGGAAWTPTLGELFDRRPIPADVAAAWRSEAGSKHPAIEAVLIEPDGGARPVGAIVVGPAARKLIGLGWLDRLRARAGLTRPPRVIPLSDSTVEKAGSSREAGLGAALGRAWRRLTGRLIVSR